MKNLSLGLLILTLLSLLIACRDQDSEKSDSESQLIVSDSIRIRDPYIFADTNSMTYYMYAQMQNRLQREATKGGEGRNQQGVEVYTSKDLKHWTAPKAVLELADDFWARKSVWAPEVHAYKGQYYLFVTLTSTEKITETPHPKNDETQWKRGTHIFRSSSLEGPFVAMQSAAHTPADWMSLDGTLWEENGTPYMVFCHEWAQVEDGTMEVVELSADLSEPIGKPRFLFKASEASWVRNMKNVGIKRNGLVTDGTFFYQNRKGELLMLWSSFGEQRYAMAMARSQSGSVFGPWEQIEPPIITADGGHGMLFEDFEGQLLLAWHQPNGGLRERLHLQPVRENEEGLLELTD